MGRTQKHMRSVLALLAESGAGWRHGYDMMKQTGLASGTLYPMLIRLTERKLVEAEWREPAVRGRPPRHAYRITAAGRAFLAASSDPAGHAPAGGRGSVAR